MKSITNLFMACLAASLFFACGSGVEGEKANTSAAETVATTDGGDTYIMGEGSLVVWEGSKLTGRHDGTIAVSEGNLTVKGGAIVAGSFVMNMASLVNKDQAGEGKGKLEGHLKSVDFFDVEKFPTAKFEITSGETLANDNTATHLIKGNLTLKDQTKNVEFKAVVTLKDGNLMATTPNFIIDRTDWNVKYGSTKFFPALKDNVINDKVSLSIVLRGKKK